jgi:hypothetical protein
MDVVCLFQVEAILFLSFQPLSDPIFGNYIPADGGDQKFQTRLLITLIKFLSSWGAIIRFFVQW